MDCKNLEQLVSRQAQMTPQNIACIQYSKQGSREADYQQLDKQVSAVALSLQQQGIQSGERVVVVADKRLETIYSLFGASRAGAIIVPVNPNLTAEQVQFIVNDCRARTLIGSERHLNRLKGVLQKCASLNFLTENSSVQGATDCANLPLVTWQQLTTPSQSTLKCAHQDSNQLAAIIYTSGSTGQPKGVMLSHRNILMGAQSVATYLENTSHDNLLLILPLSFDYGFSQLTTAFSVGASVTMLEYLLPKDILNVVEQTNISAIAAVPHVWNKLARLEWPEKKNLSLRYLTNTGGAMPVEVTRQLRTKLPGCKIYLMYGLTEAFRSTYLPPEQVIKRPASIGKAIPYASVDVVRPDGTPCAADETGEIVHTGPLVALGYWENSDATRLRFRTAPAHMQPQGSIAVWSGDLAKRDKDGYIFHIGRSDDLIKSYGFRVSPCEVEETVYQYPGVLEAIAVGIPDRNCGQAIVIALRTKQPIDQQLESTEVFNEQKIINFCRAKLPAHMVPIAVVNYLELPKNPNGKVDRKALIEQFSQIQGISASRC